MTAKGLMFATGYVGTAVALAGVAVGLTRWRALTRGQRFAALWLAASAASDIIHYFLGPIYRNTQQFAHFWFLANVVLALEALASFQHSARRARVFRLAAAAYAVAWLVLLLTIEPMAGYSTYTGPLQGLVLLGAAVVTVFRRISIGRRDLLADAGFIIAAAFCVIAIPAAVQTVATQLWLNTTPWASNALYAVNNFGSVLAEVAIIWALRPAGVAGGRAP